MLIKSSRALLFPLFLIIVFGVPGKAAASISVPSGQNIFPSYGPMVSPIINSDPSKAMPIGIGAAAIGGETVALQIGIGQFSAPVDIYFALTAPAIDPVNMYVLTPSGFKTIA